MGVSLVLRGRQGTGKGKIFEWYGKLLGPHFVHVSQVSQLIGRFNGHLEGMLAVFADEAFWAGDKAAEGALKALVTERESVVERKGIDAIRTTSYVRVLIASNNNWVVPAGFEERRFAVFDMSTKHMQDHAYFAAIDEQMKNGGLEALMHHLVHFDLKSVELRKIPRTTALREQQEETADGVTKWWKERLWQGALEPESDRWPDGEAVPVGELHQRYLTYAKELGTRWLAPVNVFAKRMRELLPHLSTVRPTDKETGERKRSYVIPPLDACRKHYDDSMGGPSEWPSGSAILKGILGEGERSIF